MKTNENDTLDFKPRIKVLFNDFTFGPGIVRIMELVEETGSLSQAYKAMGLSSSKGWKIIKNAEKELGFSLFYTVVGGKGGGGSQLSQEGRDLLVRYQSFVAELNKEAAILYDRYFNQNPI